MTWIVGTLIGNPMGRLAAKIGLVMVALGLIYLRGRSDQKTAQALATVQSLKERIDVDREIRSMPAAARRDALKRWVR